MRYVFTYLDLRSNPQSCTRNMLSLDTTVVRGARERIDRVYQARKVALIENAGDITPRWGHGICIAIAPSE